MRSLSHELIATAVNSKNEAGLFGICFQFLSEMNDMRINCACAWIVVVTPHCIEQAIATQRLSRMRNEIREQREFLCGKLDKLACALYFVAAYVDFDVIKSIKLRIGRLM